MKNLITLTMAVATLLLITAPASAQTVEWATDVDGEFNEPTDWVGHSVPGPTDSAKFAVSGATYAYTVAFHSDVTNSNLYIDNDNGATFTGVTGLCEYTLTNDVRIDNGVLHTLGNIKMVVHGNLSVGSDTHAGFLSIGENLVVDARGNITTNGTVDGTIFMFAGATLYAGGIDNYGEILGAGRITEKTYHDSMIFNTGLIRADTGTLEVDMIMNEFGATIEVYDSATFKVNGGVDLANNGSIILQNGKFDIAPVVPYMNSGIIRGHGTYEGGGSGGALYNMGLIDVTGGHMTFNVVLYNDGTVNVDSGCVATFNQDVYGSMGAFTGGNGTCQFLGTLRPGASPLLMTFAGNVELAGKVEMELGGTVRGDPDGYDAIDVGGDLTLGGTLDVVLWGEFTPEAGDTFDLFDWDANLFGTFDTINVPKIDGLGWDMSDLYTTGTLTVTPEPGTLTLLGMGALGLLAVVWRRRKR